MPEGPNSHNLAHDLYCVDVPFRTGQADKKINENSIKVSIKYVHEVFGIYQDGEVYPWSA